MSVSVVIPTTAARPSLMARALESVKRQGALVGEVIIVVDADEPARRVVESVRGAVVVGGHGQRGVSAARNLGAEVARCPVLAFLDDDDAWKEGYLSRVLGREPDFDVALTAFEKHSARGVAPEKVPPAELVASAFLVANPGLRGSNLVIRRMAYRSVGGFDESLPAFNDLDFGIRLAASGPWRYRRVVEPLVEFHSHPGPRLSTAGCDANRLGMRRFLDKHRERMSADQLEAFRLRALRLWGLDPSEQAP